HPVRVELLERAVDEVRPASEHPPGELVARIETEREAAAETQHRILVAVEKQRRMGALHRAAGDGIEGLAARRKLTGRVGLDLEAVVCRLRDVAAQRLRRAEQRIQRLRIAGSQPPLDLRRGLRDGGSSEARRGKRRGNAGSQELSALHGLCPPRPAQASLSNKAAT